MWPKLPSVKMLYMEDIIVYISLCQKLKYGQPDTGNRSIEYLFHAFGEVLKLQATKSPVHEMDRVYGGRESLSAGVKSFIDDFLDKRKAYRMQQLMEEMHLACPRMVLNKDLEVKVKKYIDNSRARRGKVRSLTRSLCFVCASSFRAFPASDPLMA